MSRARRRGAIAALLFASACATTPRDPFGAAERAIQEHDLARALQALDTVPVGHARYPEARAAAVDVERSMRRCHELVVEAMMLRAEWRDREALVTLQRAHSMWPTLTSVDVLIAATEQRLLLLGEMPGAAPHVRPAVPMIEIAAAGPAAATPAPAPTPVPERAAAAAPDSPAASSAPSPAPARADDDAPAAGDDEVGAVLVAVEGQLARGNLETAVRDLVELSRSHPRDARVRLRLARLLHQRALLRYGEGALPAAIADWRRVVEIDPDHAAAKRLLEAAEAEARGTRQ